jgi:hypothetical protein
MANLEEILINGSISVVGGHSVTMGGPPAFGTQRYKWVGQFRFETTA